LPVVELLLVQASCIFTGLLAEPGLFVNKYGIIRENEEFEQNNSFAKPLFMAWKIISASL